MMIGKSSPLQWSTKKTFIILTTFALVTFVMMYLMLLPGTIKMDIKLPPRGQSVLNTINNSLHTPNRNKQMRPVLIYTTTSNTTLKSPGELLLGSKPKMANHTSRTKPPFYPKNGTGITVDISKYVDYSVFNSFCHNTNLTIILPVYSATSNFDRRVAIRQSFGQTCSKLKQGCKLFFIIGVDLNRTVFEQVLHEYHKMKDILLIDKVDTYRDLNNKAVAMINWIDQFCSSARYILHVIDDVYPNIKLFLREIESTKETDFILGHINRPRPLRSGKWEVTKEEYPYNTYPPYTVGTANAFPMSTLKLLQSAIYISEYCWVEDVWINGHVRIKAGVKAVPLRAKYHNFPERKAKFSNTIFYHNVKLIDFSFLYNASER